MARWWTEKTVAIVTGANKGIGFAIVEKLAELGVMVVLTCRNEMKGIEAVLCLAKRGLTVEFWKEAGWPKIWTDYSVSKLAVNAYSRLLSTQQKGQNLSINCFCPGFTKTAMTGGMGTHTAEEAAEVAVRVILLPPHFLRDAHLGLTNYLHFHFDHPQDFQCLDSSFLYSSQSKRL